MSEIYKYKDKNLKLQQQPYIAGTYENPWYEASATDEAGNEYMIKWLCKDTECEDESDACDWDTYTVNEDI